MEQTPFFNKFILLTTILSQLSMKLAEKANLDDFTPVHFNIMQYIALFQPVTLSQICECQHMSMPNASRELKKLSQKQWINKSKDLTDGRKHLIELSPEGQMLMNTIFQHMQNKFEDKLIGADIDQLTQVEEAFDRILGSTILSPITSHRT